MINILKEIIEDIENKSDNNIDYEKYIKYKKDIENTFGFNNPEEVIKEYKSNT